MKTKNCIICFQPATFWMGHVLKDSELVLAGWCNTHMSKAEEGRNYGLYEEKHGISNEESPNKWQEKPHPFYNEPIDREMFGENLRIKRFMIYEDAQIKVTRVENPSYINELENYIELFVKNNVMIIQFPIGGHVNRLNAIDNAKFTWNAIKNF